jgi:hypothetical protein
MAPGSSTCRPTHKPALFVVVGGAYLQRTAADFYLSQTVPPPSIKGRSQMNQCRATTAKGERCTLPAKGSHGLCWAHAPENAEKRRRNASKAATAKADREIRQTKAEIRGLVRLVREQDFDISKANAINRLYQTIHGRFSVAVGRQASPQSRPSSHCTRLSPNPVASCWWWLQGRGRQSFYSARQRASTVRRATRYPHTASAGLASSYLTAR